jgi:hypothetical protein
MREKFSGIRALAMFAVCSLCILSATAAQGATVIAAGTKTVESCNFAVQDGWPGLQTLTRAGWPTFDPPNYGCPTRRGFRRVGDTAQTATTSGQACRAHVNGSDICDLGTGLLGTEFHL